MTWWAGYALADAAGDAITPEVPLEAGSAATLRFRSIQSFGSAAGFSLTVDGAAAVAVEDGQWGPALVDGDVPGVSIEVGPVVAHDLGECGPTVTHALIVHGDTDLTLTPVAGGPVEVGGETRFAYALAAWDFDGQPRCTDVGGAVSWALFPEQPAQPL